MAQTAAAGALFLYTEWSKDKCGLTGFHRRVIQEFCVRKANVGQSIKAYTTVLSLKLTDDQKTDAARCGVTLIPAKIQKFSDPEDEVPELKWLRYHDVHYPDINILENIQYVVGYAPKTGSAAAIIRDNVFPEAQLVLINHVCPGEQSLLGNDNEEQKLAKRMLELASEADILFSIGPKIYQYFENEYRVKFNDKQLSDIPHVEILPKPESVFFDINQTIIPGDTRCNILTYGEYDTPDGLSKCDIIAQSIGKAANVRKESRCSAPDWKIQGIAPNPKQEDRDELVKKMESSHVKPKFYPDCSVGALLTTLQQSHLCLPPPYHKDYSLQGLEAIAAGLPTRAEDGSQLAWLLKEYYEDHADYIICDSQQRPYHGEILETMRNVMVEFKKANNLKIALQAHEDIFLGSAKLTSFLTDRALQLARMNSRAQGVGENQKNTSQPNLGKDETLKMQQQPQAMQSEASGISATQGSQKVPSISTHVTPGKAENPRTQNKNQMKLAIPQQEGTYLETEEPSHIRHQTKQQHASSGIGGKATEVKKGEQASQSEVTEIDVTQAIQKAQSQPKTNHNPQNTMAQLPETIEPGTVSGKCEETQAGEKSTGVENPEGVKSQMLIGGQLGAEKSTGSREEHGSNELEVIIGVNEEPFMQKGEEVESALTDCKRELKQRAEEVVANEDGCQEIVDTVKDNVGDVDPHGLTAGSLGILLRLPGLYNLYRLKQTCKSTTLAKAFEPLLITNEVREIAAKVGVMLQLKATYNKASFKEVERFFIDRDGGGVKPVEIYTYFESKNIEEIHFDADVEDDSVKTEEKVMPCKPQISQTEVDMTGDGGGDKPVEDYTYFERKTIEEKHSDADGEDDSMKTEEKVTPYQASETEVDVTAGEKPSQLLLLEVDPKAEIQDSAEKYAPLIFNSGIYTRWKGKHYDMMQLQVKMTGQVQHILSCRPEILALLGVRRYLVRDTDGADLSNTDLEEQITESGTPILSRIDVTSSVSTQARSLLLCDTSPKQHKKYDISYYLDLAQMEVPSLAMKVSKLEQMLHTSLNEKSKFEKGLSEIKKKLKEKIVSLQTEKEILENQLAVLENQNSKSTLDRQSAERVTAQQLNDILSLKNEIRALEDRIKDKDKTIDDFKYKLSKLHVSDEKQDAELQEKIAEIRGEDYPLKEPEKGVSSDQTESGIGASAKTLEPIPIKENLSDSFTKRLFDLAQEITDAKLEDLKLLCKDKLTPRELDSLRNPSNLFNMLREKNLISASNTALLEDMLCKIGLNALVGRYFKPSTYQGVSYDQIESVVEASGSTLEPIPTKESPSDLFSKRLSDLAQDITDAKFKDLKLLCMNKLTHRELESLRHPYVLFNMLRDKNLISESNTALLEEMLYQIGLNALVGKYLKPSTYQGLVQNKMEILHKLLKDKYKRHYSKLLPIPWNDKIHLNLHEVYTSLEVRKVKEGSLKMGEWLENLHDMFKSSDTRRIRIEGAPAMGKSTLCRKLAYNWACGELQQYTLLFFLEMRHIAKNNMIDEIFNQLIPDNFDLSMQELSEIVSQNIKSVLFLCDGLGEPDEYQVESSEIPKLISEELYPWCTVVITTRPHLCDKYLSMCDLYLLVKGFTSKRTNEYVLKYFKDDTETGKSLIQQIKGHKETQKMITDLLRNPLHVSYLCILWEYRKEMGYHFPETLTELYSEILECILKRYCEKSNIELENDEIPKKVLYDRDSLASDSCKAYRNQQLYFDRSDISSEATLNFGLLVRDIGHSRIKAKQTYFFYHITWLEYFTALHVMSQLKSKDATLLEEFLEHPHRHSQILKFIAGIVQRQEGDLFFVELNKKLQNIISSL